MFSERIFLFYFFCVLTGFLAFLQQTEGDVNLAGATSEKIYFFYRRNSYPRDCKEVLDQCSVKNSSGVFVIKPDGYPYPFEVYCNNNNNSDGWTVFMRRFDGSLLFSRNWTDYKNGFGFLSSEFWLGNEKLAFLTNQKRYELGVDMTISNGLRAFIRYSHFRISDEWGNYTLATLGMVDLPPGPLPPFCPTNMVYKICTCERTCRAPTICQDNCQEAMRCVCPEGFFWRGSDCVALEECQCYSATPNKIIPMGETFINHQCSTWCSCSESGLTCNNYSCDSNATCIRSSEGGQHSSEGGQCVCNTGFIGDGRICTRPICLTNMVHKACTCERTCEAPQSCQNNCQEAIRCVCPDGFFLKGSDCVTLEECPCYSATANKVIPMGESFVNYQCSSRCVCTERGLSCSNYSCDSNAGCIRSSEGGQCACNTGFIGDGRDCRPVCPNNMIYTTCTCERTCDAPQACQNNCHEATRCVCPDGFFLRGSECVTPEDCQCYSATANKVIPVGQSHINSQCSRQCSCSRSGLSCRNHGCDQNARCTSTREGGRCTCNTGYFLDGSSCRRPKDCDEVPSVEGYRGSGLYHILPSNWREFQVYCNMSGGRWTVFQRRISGSSRDFYQSWSSYKGGFGELDEDFWLGNDKIHYLTSQKNYQLRIDITDSGNRHYRAQYNRFRIGNEGSKYRITVLGTYSGNAGHDAMRDHLNQPFTTYDQDNDDWDGSDCEYDYYYYGYCYYYYSNFLGNCARLHESGWWYKYRKRVSSPGGCDRATYYYDYYYYRYYCCEQKFLSCDCDSYAYSCAFANLNGRESGDRGKTIIWHGLRGNDCGIKYTEMKIRPL